MAETPEASYIFPRVGHKCGKLRTMVSTLKFYASSPFLLISKNVGNEGDHASARVSVTVSAWCRRSQLVDLVFSDWFLSINFRMGDVSSRNLHDVSDKVSFSCKAQVQARESPAGPLVANLKFKIITSLCQMLMPNSDESFRLCAALPVYDSAPWQGAPQTHFFLFFYSIHFGFICMASVKIATLIIRVRMLTAFSQFSDGHLTSRL
jgi:hypothetical protein